MNKNCQKNNSGFTLIEMIVVVLIIGVLASTAVISLSAMNRGKTSKSAQNLIYAMAQARQDTKTKDGMFRLDIKLEDGKYWAIETDCIISEEPDAEDPTGMKKIVTWNEIRRTEICDGAFEIQYSMNGLNSKNVRYTPIIIMFKQGSGSFWFSDANPDENKIVDTPEFDTIEVIGTDTTKIRIYELTGRSEIVFD